MVSLPEARLAALPSPSARHEPWDRMAHTGREREIAGDGVCVDKAKCMETRLVSHWRTSFFTRLTLDPPRAPFMLLIETGSRSVLYPLCVVVVFQIFLLFFSLPFPFFFCFSILEPFLSASYS